MARVSAAKIDTASTAISPQREAQRFPQEMMIMWNGRKYATMAMAGAALAAATYSPASAQYPGNGYAAIYGFGWPYAVYGAGDYGPNAAFGYGGSYGSASNGSREEDRSINVTPAPIPARARTVIHRNEPKRLE
jgi:hypothetical protein